MSDESVRGASTQRASQLGVLLVCFSEKQAAPRIHKRLEDDLRKRGNDVLDTVVIRIDEKSHTRLYDPHRVVAGVITATITWGIFGLLTGGGLSGILLNAILGGVLGGIGGYMMEHVLQKDELSRIARKLPAPSSAILLFAETRQPATLLESADMQAPGVASAVVIGEDLSAADVSAPIGLSQPLSDDPTLLSMILVRFPDPATAEQVAANAAVDQSRESLQIELIGRTDANGRRHVTDPSHGARWMAKQNIVSWGVLGLVIGAITGATGGEGIFGFLGGTLETGIGYAVFGAIAGVLYGLWTGRAVSARQLQGLAPLFPPGSSMLLAWSEGEAASTPEQFAASGAQMLILRFLPSVEGAIVTAA